MTRSFVPAAGHDVFLPFYDPLWRLLGGYAVRARFITDAGLRSGQRILDIGCGTGSLAVQIAQYLQAPVVCALDPDPKALRRAEGKAVQAGVDIEWREGFGDDLPYADASFDRVVSSFMFHHLDPGVKQGMLREACRVLTPGGELHLVDLGGHLQGKGSGLSGLVHRNQHLADNRAGRIGELFDEAGFVQVSELSQRRMIIGRYVHVRGVAA